MRRKEGQSPPVQGLSLSLSSGLTCSGRRADSARVCARVLWCEQPAICRCASRAAHLAKLAHERCERRTQQHKHNLCNVQRVKRTRWTHTRSSNTHKQDSICARYSIKMIVQFVERKGNLQPVALARSFSHLAVAWPALMLLQGALLRVQSNQGVTYLIADGSPTSESRAPRS